MRLLLGFILFSIAGCASTPDSSRTVLYILPDTFERIHRSYLVRLNEIEQVRVQEGSRYTAILGRWKERGLLWP